LTTWTPDFTAVSAQSKVATAPGFRGPSAHVLAYAVTAPPGPPDRQLYVHGPGARSTIHTGRD
jgi:hypothetical protein